jgi:DNA polymerase elongation subunit (family B)
MPGILKTKSFVPIGRQPDIKAIQFFGDENYVIDLTLPDADFFRMVIEMRSEIKAKRDEHTKGSPEYVRLEAMQLALKLIANSTSYGVLVQFDVDERETAINMTAYYGEQSRDYTARKPERGDDGKKTASGVKAEKPGTWFAPWGPLITAGGRLLIAIAECQAREEGKEYGGIHYGMCDTDSMAFVRPDGMPRDEFRAAVGRITAKFQHLNPYKPTKKPDGSLKEDEVFATEDVNYDFTNKNGMVKIVKPRMKPLYILSISAKRYAMANIVKQDGSEYTDLEDLYRDRKQATVILRKVSSHGLGHISAPSYIPFDEQPHLAVPYKYAEDDDTGIEALVLKNGKPIPLYGEVCKGKGNPRLFLDMWKLAFEQFIMHYGKSGDDISYKINSIIHRWKGLDQPQFKQRSLNTWAAWEQYANLPNKRAEQFFNVLPAPIALNTYDGGNPDTGNWVEEMYNGQALYCQGGHDAPVAKLLAEGKVWWQKDNMPANEHIGPSTGSGRRTFRLTEVRDSIGEYFDHREFKAKGDMGRLERHKLVSFIKEYVGKESNFLLDEDLAEDDESQIEDMSTQPYFRTHINPVLVAGVVIVPEIETNIGMSVLQLSRILNGAHWQTRGTLGSQHSHKVLSYIRNSYQYSEETDRCTFAGKERKVFTHERAANKLMVLIRHAYDKAVAERPSDVLAEDMSYHQARFCKEMGIVGSVEQRGCAKSICKILLTYGGVYTLIKLGKIRHITSNKYGEDTVTQVILEDFKPRLEAYLGITEYKSKIEEFVEKERERRTDPAYVEQRRMRRVAAKEKDRYENEKIIGEVLAEFFDNPMWDDIRVVTFRPDVMPIINKALRTPARERGSLRATLWSELEHWDEYGYVTKRKMWKEKKASSREKSHNHIDGAINDTLRNGRAIQENLGQAAG